MYVNVFCCPYGFAALRLTHQSLYYLTINLISALSFNKWIKNRTSVKMLVYRFFFLFVCFIHISKSRELPVQTGGAWLARAHALTSNEKQRFWHKTKKWKYIPDWYQRNKSNWNSLRWMRQALTTKTIKTDVLLWHLPGSEASPAPQCPHTYTGTPSKKGRHVGSPRKQSSFNFGRFSAGTDRYYTRRCSSFSTGFRCCTLLHFSKNTCFVFIWTEASVNYSEMKRSRQQKNTAGCNTRLHI